MRYLHWDVLLFPVGSKVPMQEFKTGCYAVQDPEFLCADPLAGTPSATFAFDHMPSPQVPIVACFLANQPDGNPFRVSLHSWERPRPGQSLQGPLQHGKSLCFEARVFIDGVGMLFLDRGPWPQVIELSSLVDKEGNRDLLRWPKFHPEMLTQSYWNAAETMGRIKVTITEGYLNAPGALPFVKVKNLVSFSFQHAPQQILESSGIAWPNAGMWYQPSRPTYHPSSPTKLDTPSEDVDLHAHSPHHRTDSISCVEERLGYKMPMQASMYSSTQVPASVQSTSRSGIQPESRAPAWSSIMPMPDPFVESGRRFGQGHFAEHSIVSDLAMPDYSHSITPASSRNATNDLLTQTRSATTVQHGGTPFDDFIPVFNSRNDGVSGLVAPANTRVNSAANTPRAPSKLSAAAEARAASYVHERSRAVSFTTKDPPPKARETSDVSMKSQFSDHPAGMKDATEGQHPPKLASEVKGRKEGRASELDVQNHVARKTSRSSIRTGGSGKENAPTMVTTAIMLSDGKRKRTGTGSGLRITPKDEEALLGSSPTRKLSKMQSVQGILESPTSESDRSDFGTPRAPLELLDNVN